MKIFNRRLKINIEIYFCIYFSSTFVSTFHTTMFQLIIIIGVMKEYYNIVGNINFLDFGSLNRCKESNLIVTKLKKKQIKFVDYKQIKLILFSLNICYALIFNVTCTCSLLSHCKNQPRRMSLAYVKSQ